MSQAVEKSIPIGIPIPADLGFDPEVQYPEGTAPFYNMLVEWREKGDFEGLIVK